MNPEGVKWWQCGVVSHTYNKIFSFSRGLRSLSQATDATSTSTESLHDLRS
jgi:hypothetical protein